MTALVQWVSACVALACAWGTPALSQSCASLQCTWPSREGVPKSVCRERLFFGSNYVHYYTSLPGVSSSSSTTDLIMVLHGLASNAGAYFHDITSVVQATGACNTAVLAPELDSKGNGCGAASVSTFGTLLAYSLSQA